MGKNAFIALVGVLSLYASVACAQSQATVRQVLDSLRQEHGVRFVYDGSLRLDIPYAGSSLHGLPLARSLDALLHGTGLTWEAEEGYVLLRPLRRCVLSGYVCRADDGETVLNATVLDLDTRVGTLTNEHGFFSLTLPEGRHRVRFSYVGLCERVETVDLSGDKRLDISLQEDNRLEEVVVTADLNSPLLTTQTGKTSLTVRELATGYALLSSPDVVKTLQTLPGVAAGTELVSGLYVHGGGNDQNLFLLDGTPLYQVNHLGGLFSAFNTDVVKNIDFYKSGFPARYGGRLSSVVDVRTDDGDMKQLHGSLSLGLIDGRLHLEGPLRKERTSFSVAMRRTWADVVTAPTMALLNRSSHDKLNTRYAFYDFNAKLTHVFSPRSRADLSFYMGNDRLKVDNTAYAQGIDQFDRTRFDLQWGNLTASLNWKYLFSPQLFATFTAVYTRNRSVCDYSYEERLTDPDGNPLGSLTERLSRSTINDVGCRVEMDYRPGGGHHLRWGTDYLLRAFRPQTVGNRDYSVEAGRRDTLAAQTSSFYRGHELSLYAEDDVAVLPCLSLNAGIRYTLFRVDATAYQSVEPRAALRYQCAAGIVLKASYAEMSQYMHQLSNTYLNLPTDYWVPSTADVRPMRSRQYALGLYMQFPALRLRVDVEGFYKTMTGLLEYDGGNQLTPSADDWTTLVRRGRGKAYGAEVCLGWERGTTSFVAAYTLSWSRRLFPDFYSGWYPDKFDNRHKLDLTLRHRFNARIEAVASWTCRSGNRFTVPQQQADAPLLPGWDGTGDERLWVYEQPNNVALPLYHRLDLGVNFHRTTRRGFERIWNVSVYNAYCRTNALYAEVVQRPDGTFRGKARGVFPIVPSFSYTLKF